MNIEEFTKAGVVEGSWFIDGRMIVEVNIEQRVRFHSGDPFIVQKNGIDVEFSNTDLVFFGGGDISRARRNVFSLGGTVTDPAHFDLNLIGGTIWMPNRILDK